MVVLNNTPRMWCCSSQMAGAHVAKYANPIARLNARQTLWPVRSDAHLETSFEGQLREMAEGRLLHDGMQCLRHVIEVEASGAQIFAMGSRLELSSHFLPIEPWKPAASKRL